MSSKDLKYCKLESLKGIDFICESFQQNKLNDIKPQVLEDLLRSKQRVITSLNSTIKEYFQRVKLEKEISILNKQQTTVSHKLSELHKKLQLIKEDIENGDSSRNVHKILLFEQNLAMRIEPTGDLRISEGDVAISMQFGHVSESKPEETGSFVLIVTESNRYKASNCHPPIAEMEELISSLNKTNDLHQFVVSVRKHFKKCFIKSDL